MANVIEIIFKAVDDVTKVTGQMDGSLENLGKSMTKVGAVATAGLTLPILAFGRSAVQSAIESENEMAELEAVIKSTGGAAGLTADQVSDMATQLQKVTKFSDEQILSGQSMLLTFTQIGKDVFPQATEAMLNMGEKFGSIDQAAVQLGKALNDPITGVTALRRVGVMLTDAQEEQIKKFMEMGDVASAQKVILKELEVEFGGLARAAGETTAGKLAQATNAFDNMKESIGTALLPHLVKLAEVVSKLADAFTNLPPGAQTAIIVILGLVAAIGPLLMIVGSVITTMTTLAPILATVGGVITGTLIPAAGTLIAALAPVILPILAIVAVLGLLYLAWKTNFAGIRDTVEEWVSIFKNLWGAFTAFLKGDTEGMVEHLTNVFDIFKNSFNEVFEKVFGIQDAWGQMTAFIKTSLLSFLTPIMNVVNAVENLRSGAVKLYEDGSGALLKLAVAFGLPKEPVQDLLSRLWMLLDRVREVAGWIWDRLAPAFDRIGDAIRDAIHWVGEMAHRLSELRIPKWLTPGSPTPLELGLLGIRDAMSQVASENPFFGRTGGSAPLGMPSAGGGQVIVNFTYAPAVSLASQREAELVLGPVLEQAVRRMQADGRVPSRGR